MNEKAKTTRNNGSSFKLFKTLTARVLSSLIIIWLRHRIFRLDKTLLTNKLLHFRAALCECNPHLWDKKVGLLSCLRSLRLHSFEWSKLKLEQNIRSLKNCNKIINICSLFKNKLYIVWESMSLFHYRQNWSVNHFRLSYVIFPNRECLNPVYFCFIFPIFFLLLQLWIIFLIIYIIQTQT